MLLNVYKLNFDKFIRRLCGKSAPACKITRIILESYSFPTFLAFHPHHANKLWRNARKITRVCINNIHNHQHAYNLQMCIRLWLGYKFGYVLQPGWSKFTKCEKLKYAGESFDVNLKCYNTKRGKCCESWQVGRTVI